MRLVFVDTSGIVAAMNAKDRCHGKALAVFRELAAERCVLVVTNYVRAETHALLLARAGRELALRFLEDESWAVEWVEPEDEKRAMEILRRFQDKDFSLTDAVSFAVMERLGIKEAVSFDRHFSQYGLKLVDEA
ncbi:MAG: PIN domain-containing protein [Bacillota bacterium]|nr:PIN domain-containing protein [Bacillota bacterium]